MNLIQTYRKDSLFNHNFSLKSSILLEILLLIKFSSQAPHDITLVSFFLHFLFSIFSPFEFPVMGQYFYQVHFRALSALCG